VPDLLFASGRLRDGGIEVVLPDGTVTTDDDVLSDWLGRRVALRGVGDVPDRPRYEAPDDDLAEAETNADGAAVQRAGRWHDWQGGAGAFHDNSGGRVSLITTGTLGAWDRRRFRSNVVLAGAGEGGLVGTRVRLGDAVLDVGDPIPRCVIVTRPQPGGIPRDTSVLKTIHRENGGDLAVGALVHAPGRVRVGDELRRA
jgi:uncharacterized protein YcbX